jgi:hypothetical protein
MESEERTAMRPVRAGPPSRLGEYQVEQPRSQAKAPLLMGHGGGLTDVTFETTPERSRGLA